MMGTRKKADGAQRVSSSHGGFYSARVTLQLYCICDNQYIEVIELTKNIYFFYLYIQFRFNYSADDMNTTSRLNQNTAPTEENVVFGAHTATTKPTNKKITPHCPGDGDIFVAHMLERARPQSAQKL